MFGAGRTTEWGRRLFLVSYILMLVRVLLSSSTFVVYLNADGIFFRYILRILLWLPIFVKLFTQDRFTGRTFLAYCLFACLILAITVSGRSFELVDLAILVIGVHGVPLRSVVRAFFYTAATVCLTLFCMSLCGIIENFVSISAGRPRYAFGNVYATDFAATVFYIELAHAYLKGKRYNFRNFLFWMAVSAFIMLFCVARLDFALIFCTAWVMLAVGYFPRLFSLRAVKVCLWSAIPIFCILSIVLHAVYAPGNSFLAWLNDLLSGRLYYGNMAFRDYGFSLFGKRVVMQGWGFSTDEWDAELGYYFVDCGWLSIALRFGVVMLVFVCTVFTLISKSSLKKGDCILPIILFFLALTSMVDHHMLEYHFDPFLLVLNAGLCTQGGRVRAARRAAVPERG